MPSILGKSACSGEIEGDLEVNTKHFYVGYWDLLGQKDAMKDIWEASSKISQEAQERVNITTSAILSALATIRQMYAKDDCMADLLCVLRKNEPKIWKDVTEGELKHEFNELECGVCQFSDSTLFYIEGGKRLTIPLLQYTCRVIGKLMPRLHACGLYPRGAIGFGDADVIRQGNIVGTVVDSVSKVENKASFYARIVVISAAKERINAAKEITTNVEYSPNYANMLLSMIQGEPDGYWSINPLAKIVIDDSKGSNELRDYVHCIKSAYSHLTDSLELLRSHQLEDLKNSNLKKVVETSRIIDKTIYLHHFYKQRIADLRLQGIMPTDGLTFADIARNGNVPISDYLIIYIALDPMDDDAKKNSQFALESYLSFIKNLRDELKCCPNLFYKNVINSLRNILGEDKFCEEASHINVGIQQVSSHLMIFVRKTNPASLLIFLHMLREMSIGLVNVVCAKHGFSAAVCVNRGWEIEQDCLQGPVISEAYQLAMKTERIGRIAVSYRFYNEVNRDVNVSLQWPEIKEKSFIIDSDGLLTWNYALKGLEHDYKKVYNDGSFLGLCTKAKDIVCGHIEKMSKSEVNTSDPAAKWRAYKFWEKLILNMIAEWR